MKKSRLRNIVCFILVVFFAFNISWAQKPSKNSQLEIIPDEVETSVTLSNMRLNETTGVPITLYTPNYKVNADTPERMARQYLSENHNLFKISQNLSELKYLTTRETPGGYHVHFDQYIGQYPVLDSRVNVTIGKDNRVMFVANGMKIDYNSKKGQFNLESIKISTEQALSSAKNYLGISGPVVLEKSEPGIYYNKGLFNLVQVVTIVPAEELTGDWQVLVDAQSGNIIRVEDKACYDDPTKYNPQLVNGTGYVFDPDPITHARTTYGSPGFTDNNDADSDSLTAHRELRTLNDITFSGGVYSLVGPWAEIRDFEAPYTGLHTNTTSDFNFTRSNKSFEAVNTYFHIDNSMRWINVTLNYPLAPIQYTGGVRFDPHGLNGDDNAHYIPSSGSIAYGDGGIDDGEDCGVILHELGHGLHDWLTNGSLSQVQGLSEGCGDYWTSSYIRSTGYWTPSDQAYNWVFIWDGHNQYWAGRVTNYAAHYPNGLTGTIHTDGQMWASSLMSIYDLIGKAATDKNFLEALSMTNSSSNQADAANAFITADQLQYSGSHLSQIIPVFVDRGYITGPITTDFTADVKVGPAPLTVHFTDLSVSAVDSIVSWQWDFNNDGTVDATDKNPTWVYNNVGIYSVKLTVSDGTNTSFKTKTNYINVHDPNMVIAFNEQFNNLNCWSPVGPVGTTNWSVQSGSNAGGSAPSELRLSWTPSFNGLSKLRSCDITSLAPGTVHNISLKHFCDWYSNPAPQLGIGISYDNGSTYSSVWQIQPTSNVGPETVYASFTPTSGTFQLVLFANGNSFNIDYWYVDDIQIDFIVPVELTSFSVLANSDDIELKWTTATETNNQGFQIERALSSTVPEWKNIGYAAGFGTTTEPKSYSFVDSKVSSGTYIYRLKQIDFDGTYKYSNEVSVEVTLPLEYSLEQNYPNPFNPSTTIKYSIPEDGFVKLSVYNMLGEEVSTLVNGNQEAGRYELSFNASELSSGVYVYRLEAPNYTSSKKLILLR